MNLSQIKNKALVNCALDERPFATLTLSGMIEKFHIEATQNIKYGNEINHKNLKELNPFDGSFQIEMVSDNSLKTQNEETDFIEIRSFAQRAKEEGLI